MPVKRKRLLASCVAAIGTLSSISDAPAQTWLGLGPGTRLWNDASNWIPQMPVSGDTTRLTFIAPSFSAPNYTSANNLPGTFVLNSITLAVPGNTGGYGIFAPPPPTTTISGNPLEFRVDGITGAKPEIRQTLGRTIAITNNLHFDDELRIGGPGAGGIAFTGALSGTGSLIKTGGQQFYFGRIDQLTPDATFSGGARIDGGDFFISTSAATLPKFGTGALTIKNSLVRLQFSGEQWNLDAPTTLIGSVSFGAQYKCVYNLSLIHI